MNNTTPMRVLGATDVCGLIATAAFAFSGVAYKEYMLRASGILLAAGALPAFFPGLSFGLSALKAGRAFDNSGNAEPSRAYFTINNTAALVLSIIGIMLLLINVLKYFGG